MALPFREALPTKVEQCDDREPARRRGVRRHMVHGFHAPARAALLASLFAAGACASDLLLGPDAAQGIDGIALRGPLCPVVTVDDPCPDAPHQAWIRVLDAGGAQVTRVRSGEDGRFRVGLEPGRYRVVGEGGDPFPRGGEEQVTVTAAAWVSVTLRFDTGIR